MFSASKSGQYQGYLISRSVRLRSSASAFFNRTPASASSLTTWTWSGWVKRGALSGATFPTLFFAGSSAQPYCTLSFTNSDQLQFDCINAGSTVVGRKYTTSVYRDPSAWYHIVFVWDTTNATAADRMRIFVNGVRITAFAASTDPALNATTQVNTTAAHQISNFGGAGNFFDGYLTEINFIDGQALTPASFGAYNAYGVWSPMKYNGTYGNNGFYLNFSDPSAATAAAIGKDYSGNGNNWTPNNISVTAGATYDSMLDVPTPWGDGGNGRGNYAVLNPITSFRTALTNGNLTSGTGDTWSNSTIGVASGKWYAEFTVTTLAVVQWIGVGQNSPIASYNGFLSADYSYAQNGQKYNNNVNAVYGASYISGDVIGVAFDADSLSLEFFKNGVSQGVAYTSMTAGTYYFQVYGRSTGGSSVVQANFGQRPFAYTPPSGFRALNTFNLPTPTIAKGNQYFDVNLWTGNGSTQNIVNSGAMQPDLVWIKSRSTTWWNHLIDAVRGPTKQLYSNATDVEGTVTDALTSFNSNGFSLNLNTGVNQNAQTYVGWQWKAGGTPAVTNTAGSITSTVSAGATQGFSVVTFTTPGGSNPQTIGHGLGVAPRMIIMKSRNNVSGWTTYHASVGNTGALNLQATTATSTAIDWWQNTSPTSSVWSIGANLNLSTWTWVAYCFSEVAGFSRFGSYTGNGSADGPMVFTGFSPRFIMVKSSSAVGSWCIYDTSTGPINPNGDILLANSSGATNTGNPIDILSNGFKLRNTNASQNASGVTYIFMAFAENPLKYSLAR